MSPVVGSITPARHFSSVDLPPPLPAISPKRSVSPITTERCWNRGCGDSTPTSRKLIIGMVVSLGSMKRRKTAFGAGRRELTLYASVQAAGQPCDNLSQGPVGAARMMLVVRSHAALLWLDVTRAAP